MKITLVEYELGLQWVSSMERFANKVAMVSSHREVSPLALGSPVHALKSQRFMGHALLPCLLFVVFFTGCEGSLQTHDLQGTVTFNGKAVPTGWVIFLSDEEKRNTAEIDAEGHFQTALPAGEHQVGVFAPRESNKTGMDAFYERPMPPYVPTHFGQPEHTGLRVTIQENDENTLDLTLVDKRRRRRR